MTGSTAAFAALLHPAVKQLDLHHALTSYSDIAEAEKYDWPLSTFLPGVLRHFDLPDIYAALGTRLNSLEPRGPEKPAT